MSNPDTFYDAFSCDYDRFVNWTGRLAVEIPFLQQQLRAAGAYKVLDAACGTGMHAIALAESGFEMAAGDLSIGMIQRTQKNAQIAKVTVRAKQAGFGELAGAFGMRAFDSVLCLGNSLPHLLTKEHLSVALMDFANCLRPGGLLVIQNRNFDLIMQNQLRWMEPQSAKEGNAEWLFVRFYDFESAGLLTFHVITLYREDGRTWSQVTQSTQLRPILSDEIRLALQTAGFESVVCFGNLTGSPFDAASSGNLVLCARLAGT